jgi:hypothetical protein
MATYKLIASYTTGAGGINTITFSSIPQTYTHLQIRGIARNSSCRSTMAPTPVISSG